jgi:hypothetical protein
MTYDPRTLGTPVYEQLSEINSQCLQRVSINPDQEEKERKRRGEQKSFAREIYTYISVWGLMRFKAEEMVLSQDGKPPGKRDVVQAYFRCLQQLSGRDDLTGPAGLGTLKRLEAEEYLGLTGISLAIAQEFSFWANAVYHDISAGVD